MEAQSLLQDLDDDVLHMVVAKLLPEDGMGSYGYDEVPCYFEDIVNCALAFKPARAIVVHMLHEPGMLAKIIKSCQWMPPSWLELGSSEDERGDDDFDLFQGDTCDAGTLLRRCFTPLRALGLEFDALRASVELQRGDMGRVVDVFGESRSQLECFLIAYHATAVAGPAYDYRRNPLSRFSVRTLDEESATALGTAAARLQLPFADVSAIFHQCRLKDDNYCYDGEAFDEGTTVDVVIAWAEHADLTKAGWTLDDVVKACAAIPEVLGNPYFGFTLEWQGKAYKPFALAVLAYITHMMKDGDMAVSRFAQHLKASLDEDPGKRALLALNPNLIIPSELKVFTEKLGKDIGTITGAVKQMLRDTDQVTELMGAVKQMFRDTGKATELDELKKAEAHTATQDEANVPESVPSE